MKDDKKYYFDRPETVSRWLRVFYVICGLLLVADVVYHRHAIHAWEGVFGFYAIYGFVACVVLVLVATQLRKLLMRSEKYYEDDDDD